MTDMAFYGHVSQVAGRDVINESPFADRSELLARRASLLARIKAVQACYDLGRQRWLPAAPILLCMVFSWLGCQITAGISAMVLFATVFIAFWAQLVYQRLDAQKTELLRRVGLIDDWLIRLT